MTEQSSKLWNGNPPILSWDTAEIASRETEYRMTNPEDFSVEGKTEDEVFQDVLRDGGLFNHEFDYLCDALTEMMENVAHRFHFGYWYCEVSNFGWRSQGGHKYFKADTGKELLQQILPKTPCTYKIFRPKDRRTPKIMIQNYHHDSPVGKEWYHIWPMTVEQIEERYG